MFDIYSTTIAHNAGYDEQDIAKLDAYMVEKGYASLLSRIEENERLVKQLQGKIEPVWIGLFSVFDIICFFFGCLYLSSCNFYAVCQFS